MSPKISLEIDAEKLRSARHGKALTLRELSEITGIDHNVIWMYEKGRRSPIPRNLRKLASALGVNPSDLTIK